MNALIRRLSVKKPLMRFYHTQHAVYQRGCTMVQPHVRVRVSERGGVVLHDEFFFVILGLEAGVSIPGVNNL